MVDGLVKLDHRQTAKQNDWLSDENIAAFMASVDVSEAALV